MSEHTREPWSVSADRPWIVMTSEQSDDGAGKKYAACGGGNGSNNARRIVACVNACAGISTESLELVDGAAREAVKELEGEVSIFHAMEKQRDEALAALEHAKVRAERGHHGDLIAYDISIVLEKIKATP